MSELFTKLFWLDTAERSVKSLAQGILVGTGLGENVTGILSLNWLGALSIGISMAVASILTSVMSAGVASAAQGAATASLLSQVVYHPEDK